MKGTLALLIFLLSTLHHTEFLGGDSRVLSLVEECILPLSSEIIGCCSRHCCLGLVMSLEGDLTGSSLRKWMLVLYDSALSKEVSCLRGIWDLNHNFKLQNQAFSTLPQMH